MDQSLRAKAAVIPNSLSKKDAYNNNSTQTNDQNRNSSHYSTSTPICGEGMNCHHKSSPPQHFSTDMTMRRRLHLAEEVAVPILYLHLANSKKVHS